MDEETMLATNTLFSIKDIVIPIQKKESKHQFEFQEICTEMVNLFGKDQSSRIWALPYKSWFSEHKARKAIEIAKTRNICTLNYVIGIIKKMV